MFDHSWNKGNQRLSQAWEKASKKQDAPAANALPTSVLLQRVLAPDRGKWKGGALKRVGDGLRENEERAAHPKLNMGQPAPRPPAPTARFGSNPLSRGAPSAPAVNSAGRHTQSAPVVDDAMREQMERRRLEALRKLAARAPAPGAADAPPARPPAPSHVACETKANKASRAPSSVAFGPSRDGAQRRRLSGGAARGARAADAASPDQFFGVELFLAHEASPDGSVETFDRLHVRAKSFPGYPANAVLSWATSPASPAGETKKWLLEKGEVAVWRVTPATAYRALLDRAAREPLLAVQDAVATRVARAGAARDAADETLARDSSIRIPSRVLAVTFSTSPRSRSNSKPTSRPRRSPSTSTTKDSESGVAKSMMVVPRPRFSAPRIDAATRKPASRTMLVRDKTTFRRPGNVHSSRFESRRWAIRSGNAASSAGPIAAGSPSASSPMIRPRSRAARPASASAPPSRPEDRRSPRRSSLARAIRSL